MATLASETTSAIVEQRKSSRVYDVMGRLILSKAVVINRGQLENHRQMSSTIYSAEELKGIMFI